MVETPSIPAAEANESPAKGVIRRQQRALQIRQRWETVFDECYELTMPGRETFVHQDQGRVRTDRIFDETAVSGLPEFASRLQAGLVPTFAEWTDLAAGSDVPEDQVEEVNEDLKTITTKMFETLRNSNFNQEVHESFMDLGVGTGCLLALEGDAVEPIHWAAIPLPRVAFNIGATGTIDAIYREHNLRLDQIREIWRRAKFSQEVEQKAKGDAEMRFVVVEEELRDRKKIEPTYDYRVVLKTEEEIIHEDRYTGIGSSPWIVFRWSKASGEVYGRGPVLNALPAIKTLNLTIQLILENADQSIQGLWQYDDDGIINVNTIELDPGTVIPRSPGTRGLEALENPGRLDVAQLILDDMRHNVRKALFNEGLGAPEGTPMSATEVSSRMADLARQIGSAFGRLQYELVTPVVQRVIYVLRKKGIIEMPQVDGRLIRLVPTSPLSRAQVEQEITDMERYAMTLVQMFGPQIAQVFIDHEKFALTLADKLDLDRGIVRPKASREQLVKAIAEAAQQAQQMPQGAPQGMAAQ